MTIGSLIARKILCFTYKNVINMGNIYYSKPTEDVNSKWIW